MNRGNTLQGGYQQQMGGPRVIQGPPPVRTPIANMDGGSLSLQRRAASVSPTKYFDQIYNHSENPRPGIIEAKSDGNLQQGNQYIVKRPAEHHVMNTGQPTTGSRPVQHHPASKPSMAPAYSANTLERQRRGIDRPPSVPLQGRNTPTPTLWPSGDVMPGRMTPTRQLQRSPSTSKKSSEFPKQQLSDRFTYSSLKREDPMLTASTPLQNDSRSQTPQHQFATIPEPSSGGNSSRQFAASTSRPVTMNMNRPDIIQGRAHFPVMGNAANQDWQNRNFAVPSTSPQYNQQTNAPPPFPRTASNSGAAAISVSAHPRRVSPTTHVDGASGSLGDYKKHKRRDPPAPKFYDSSTDEAPSLSGRGRHHRATCLTPSEHQLSPVSGGGALPLLPEHGTNHEHLIVQSVEKMQSNERGPKPAVGVGQRSSYVVEDYDDDSYLDMPSTDGAAGPSTPILPALSPVDSGDENTERQPFLSQRLPGGKQTSATGGMSHHRMPKPKKGSFMKSIQDNKLLVKNFVSRKDSDLKKKPGESTTDEDIRDRVEKLEALCERISKILGVEVVEGGATVSNTSWTNAGNTGTLGGASSPRSSNLQRSNSMRTRWSKRRAKDNTAINKRFQKIEQHVINLVHRVGQISEEMNSAKSVLVQLDSAQKELSELQESTQQINQIERFGVTVKKHFGQILKKNEKLTWFFGEKPPLLEDLLVDLKYSQYVSVFKKNHIGLVEYPLLSEDKLTQLGVGPGVQALINHEYLVRFCGAEPSLHNLSSNSLGRSRTPTKQHQQQPTFSGMQKII